MANQKSKDLQSYTFKICGMDKELKLKLSEDTTISDILEKISHFTQVHSSSLQIRNCHEALSDIGKKLKEYTIEDPSKYVYDIDMIYRLYIYVLYKYI